jgi:hypothetical protein
MTTIRHLLITLTIFLVACDNTEYWLQNPQGQSARIVLANDSKSSNAPRSLDSLPTKIKDSTTRHLLAHVGKTYLSKLTFVGGQILEYENGTKEYYLYYSLTDATLGKNKYIATIAVNQDGQLIQQIDLPDVVQNPYKTKVITPHQAFNEVMSKTIDYGKLINLSISFDKNTSSIEWTFTFETNKGNDRGYKHIISVDAHRGLVLDQHKMLDYDGDAFRQIDNLYEVIDSTRY